MRDFKSRLETEKSELDEKITKLNSFLQSDKTKDIDPKQLTLLMNQISVMEEYGNILTERIELLNN